MLLALEFHAQGFKFRMPPLMKHVINLTLALNLAACALKEPHADKIALASSHNLSASVSEMERRVAGGDTEAASALARYYEFIELDEKKSGFWFKEAARLRWQE
jgi:hypothetical protein